VSLPFGTSFTPVFAELEADRACPIPYGNPESLIESGVTRRPPETYGHGVAPAGTVLDLDLASHRRPGALNTIAELDDGIPVCGLHDGKIAVARAGVSEVWDILPTSAIHADHQLRVSRTRGPHRDLRHGRIVSRQPPQYEKPDRSIPDGVLTARSR
jgi:hypothetical protein